MPSDTTARITDRRQVAFLKINGILPVSFQLEGSTPTWTFQVTRELEQFSGRWRDSGELQSYADALLQVGYEVREALRQQKRAERPQ